MQNKIQVQVKIFKIIKRSLNSSSHLGLTPIENIRLRKFETMEFSVNGFRFDMQDNQLSIKLIQIYECQYIIYVETQIYRWQRFN